MVIANGNSADGRKLLLLGLSAENVKRLLLNQPITLNSTTHQGTPEGWTIVIMFGNTELEIHALLKAKGVIDAQTEIKIDERLKP
jgi:hypothetical protein